MAEFEKWIENNSDKMDVESSGRDLVWERLDKRLERSDVLQDRKHRTRQNRWIIRLLGVLTLLIAVIAFSTLRHSISSGNNEFTKEELMAYMFEQNEEANLQHIQMSRMISLRENEIFSSEYEHEILSELKNDLKELDKSFEEDQKLFLEQGEDDRSLYAMLNYYQEKLNLLNQIIEIKKNLENHEEYEKSLRM